MNPHTVFINTLQLYMKHHNIGKKG